MHCIILVQLEGCGKKDNSMFRRVDGDEFHSRVTLMITRQERFEEQ